MDRSILRSQIGVKRVLIVSCYEDETRRPVARTHKVPHTVGPQFLAGGFNPERWEIRLCNEHSHGPLQDETLLGWPDVLVLTGLITSSDRMRHLTAYARTKNPRVLVVGGGHVVRAFPNYCKTFMDCACLGDVEEIQEVIAEAFGPEYAAEEFCPRLDLASWIGKVGYVESTRNCNFACSFCTLSAERRAYKTLGQKELRRQFDRLGKKWVTIQDLDSTTLCLRTVDPQPEAAAFMKSLQTLAGYQSRVARHSLAFAKNYRKQLTRDEMIIGLSGGALTVAPLMATGPKRMRRRRARRTHVSTTEPLDRFYDPAFTVDARFESYFQPTMLTDAEGGIADAIAEDDEASRPSMPDRRFRTPKSPQLQRLINSGLVPSLSRLHFLLGPITQ